MSLPGSHDSFTFWVDVHAPVGPDQKAYVKYLATMFSVLAKKVMVKWSMTQVPSSNQWHVQTQLSMEPGSLQMTWNDIFWADFV